MMKRYSKSMLSGPLLPNIISYTIPIILTSLLQLLFNAADLVVVGRFRGSLSVAAVSATGALINSIDKPTMERLLEPIYYRKETTM